MAERRNATETYVQSQLGLYVPKSLYDANTVLAATTDDTPAAITMGASTILARLASGNIKAASVAEIATLLSSALQGYELGYDQRTTDVTVSSTTESSGTSVIAGSAHTFDGTPVIATFLSPQVQLLSGVNNYVVVNLFEGSTQIGRFATIFGNSLSFSLPMAAQLRFTPSAGSHTYSITAFRNNANATISAGSGGTATYIPTALMFNKETV